MGIDSKPAFGVQVSDTHASLVWSTTPTYAALIKSLPLEVLAPLVDAAFTLPHAQLTSFLDSLLPSPEPLAGSTTTSPPAAAPIDAPALANRLQGLLVAHSQATYDPSNPAAPLPPSVVSVQPSSVASFPLRLSHTSSYLGLPTPPPPPPAPSPSPSTSDEHATVMAPVAAANIAQDMRTVLVGDAAHTVHPLAGQGLNLGLADSRSLSTLLTRLALQGADLGAYLSLKPYPKERYLANHAVLSACDHLASLYARTDPVSIWARSTGVEVLNELGPVKDLIMRRAGSADRGTATATATGSGGHDAGAWGAVAGGGGGGGGWGGGGGQVKDVASVLGRAAIGQAGARLSRLIVQGK